MNQRARPTLGPGTLAAILATVLACVTGCGDESRPEQRAKHLLFISVDTLRADRLRCYGGPNETSPTIDRLAAEGTLFEQAYTERGQTLPSFASFFTSKYPTETGVVDNKKNVPDEEWLLAERLQEEGFHTRCFNASGVLAPREAGNVGRGNIDQGYAPRTYTYIPDEEILTAKATRYLEEKFGREGRREFVWIHYMNPHKPYRPPPPYDTLFDPGYTGEWTGDGLQLDRVFSERIDLAPRDLEHVLAVYDGTVRYVDECVKRLMEALEKSGQREDTLVVFAADHGEELYSHQHYFYHANSPYRSVTQIALIFHQPGKVAPQRSQELVETVDFLPTVLDWLGVGVRDKEGVDDQPRGFDLGPLLRGEGGRVPRDFVISRVDEFIFGARNREWSYYMNPREAVPSFPPEGGEYRVAVEELYHLKDDPDEQRNIVAEHPDKAEALSRAIQAWRDKVVGRTLADREMDEATLRELAEQGYIGLTEFDQLMKELDKARAKRSDGATGEGAERNPR